MSDSRTYEDWISVFETGTDYEADLVRDRLDDAGMTAVVLTQRDHAFNLNVGDLAAVHVMVPPDTVKEARELLESQPFSDEELNEAAMNADPDAEPAHTDREEAILDSSPNIAGDEEGPIEEPGVHQPSEEEREEADPQAKRHHREERRARHEGENRPAGEDVESVARESDELRDRASGQDDHDEDDHDEDDEGDRS